MRLRVVLPVLGLGALALLAGGLLLFRGSGSKADPPPPLPPAEPVNQAEVAPSVPERKPDPLPVADTPATNSVAAQHQAYVTERCSELEDLAMDDKPESLASILGELTNRDPEIRQAAINAAVQFGSREAIPKLMDALTQTDDPDEQMALLEAIKFLKLPTLSELAEQARTNAVTGNP